MGLALDNRRQVHPPTHQSTSPMGQDTQDENSASSCSDSKSAGAAGSEQYYDPNRVVSPEHLEAFDLLVHPVWIFDFIQRRNRYANTEGLKLWNSSSLEEFLNRDMSQISPAAEARTQHAQDTVEAGKTVEEQWTFYPKGRAKTVHLTMTGLRLSHEEDHCCMLMYAVPLVNQDLLNESLRGVEMLRHLPMAVCQFDLDGNVMFQNPAAQLPASSEDDNSNEEDGPENDTMNDAPPSGEITTSNDETDMPQDFTENDEENIPANSASLPTKNGDFIHRFVNRKVAKEVLQAIRTQDNVNLEAELRTSHGPQWSAIQLRKTHDPLTSQPVILYSAQDKSDAIEAKRHREASIQKSEFLAIMAHEIRTPLHQVTGFIDLLDQTSLDNEQKSFVKLLKSSAQGLMTVISDVLDYSKLEAGQMKIERIPYEPLSVVQGSISALRASCEEKGLSLTLDWNKTLPFRLLGDPNRLRQILLNLLSNATKFTKTGGIHVEAYPVSSKSGNSKIDDKINGTNGVDNNELGWIKFVVNDTGMGICEAHQDMIFQKYQQANLSVARNFGGTGLGLSICQLLVQSMGGFIGVNSQLGRGSSFWIVLPIEVPNNSDTAEAVEEINMKEISGLNVLVAEDNKINQKLVVNMLKRMGHKSTVAANGQEAIDLVKCKKFDVILMDIQMPVMDGLEATRRLRTLGYNDLPIYGLTASVMQRHYADLGFDDWLSKPILMKDLKAKLYRLKECQDGFNDDGRCLVK